ncbi:MAG: hypothetical protein Wins2KO_27150 [Winogradskyella sp.]
MKKTLLIVLICGILMTSCSSDKVDPFLIQKQNIGLLTDSTMVKDLETIFINDSVVKLIAGDEFAGSVNSVEIFEKGGKKLLNLTPRETLDSTSVITSIRIFDNRYHTEKQISNLSTFKDIKEAYKISSIDNLINSVVVSVDEINASFTIDKKELPSGLRFDMDTKIDPIQIPGKAKIKYFIIHW